MASLSSINTADPIALRSLMTETIFDIGAADDGAIADERVLETGRIIEAEKPFDFAYYGKNKRNYLFLTQDEKHDWMSASAMDAFVKTLAALKLTTDDVAVLNMAKLPEIPAIADLTTFFKPKVVVILGAPFDWQDQGGVAVFRTNSFDEMLVDAEMKRNFWTTIRTLLV